MSNSIKNILIVCMLLSAPFVTGAANNTKSTVKTEARGKGQVSQTRFTAKVKNEAHTYLVKLGSHAHTFYIESKPYYCDNGSYYQFVSGKGYEEIYMPTPVVVQDLPYGARRNTINGYIYYNADGMWFQQIKDKFLLIKQPQVQTADIDTIPSKAYKATFGY